MNRAIQFGELLERVCRANTAHNKPILHAWVKTLGVQNSGADFLVGMAAVLEQAELLKLDFVNADISERSKRLFCEAVEKLEPFYAFPHIQSQQLQHLEANKSQIDIIFMAGDTIPSRGAPVVNPLTLDALRGEISHLIDEVEASPIDTAFRALIARHLRTLLVAVNSFEVLGQEGAAKVYGAAAAQLARLAAVGAAPSPEATSLFRRALEVCKKTGAAVIFVGAVVGGAHAAIEDGTSLLGLAGGGSPSSNEGADGAK